MTAIELLCTLTAWLGEVSRVEATLRADHVVAVPTAGLCVVWSPANLS